MHMHMHMHTHARTHMRTHTYTQALLAKEDLGRNATDGKSFPGTYIYKVFAKAGLHEGNHQIVRDNFDKAVALILARALTSIC